jgi:hypothetical protein
LLLYLCRILPLLEKAAYEHSHEKAQESLGTMYMVRKWPLILVVRSWWLKVWESWNTANNQCLIMINNYQWLTITINNCLLYSLVITLPGILQKRLNYLKWQQILAHQDHNRFGTGDFRYFCRQPISPTCFYQLLRKEIEIFSSFFVQSIIDWLSLFVILCVDAWVYVCVWYPSELKSK